MGYSGVETAGFPAGVLPKQAKALFNELGLTVTSAHSPLPLGENQQQVLDTLAVLDCPHLVSPWMDPGYYASVDKIKQVAEIFNQAYAVAVENGLQFSIHNHDFEFALLDGKPAIDMLREYLDQRWSRYQRSRYDCPGGRRG